MLLVIWHILLFHGSRLFISFFFTQKQPNVSNPGENVMILISKVFSKTIKFIQCRFQTRNFNCTTAEVTEGFQDKCLFLYLLLTEILFCLWPTTKLNVSRFDFKSAKWIGNVVVCSPNVSLRIISFRHLFRHSVWNFGCPRVILIIIIFIEDINFTAKWFTKESSKNKSCLGAFGHRALVRQQPCELKPISIWHINVNKFLFRIIIILIYPLITLFMNIKES